MLAKRFLTIAVAGFTIVSCASTPDAPQWDGETCPDIGAVSIAKEYLNDTNHVRTLIKKVRGACLVEDGVIDLDLYIDTNTQNLGGVAETQITVPVFTAVVNQQEEALSKTLHTINVILPPMNKTAEQSHTINVTFKMPEMDSNPNDYHFVAGFQLGE